MVRLLIAAFSLVNLVACATMITHQNAMEEWSTARICCDALEHVECVPLGESIKFNLDGKADAFDFVSGKSYFKILCLPPRETPYRIRIRSFALGEHIDVAHIFLPQVDLLDERFSSIHRSSPHDFAMSKAGQWETASVTWGLPVKFEGSIAVDDPKARYVLVYTTRELMEGFSYYMTWRASQIVLPSYVSMVPTYKERIKIPHSPFGLLHLEILEGDAQAGEGDRPVNPRS